MNMSSVGRVCGGSVIAALALTTVVAVPARAAEADVVINEIMYSAESELDADEFLELHNRGSAPVDLSGWCFSGITLCFAAGQSIAADGYLAISPDASRFQATYGGSPAAIYTGKLSNGGETLALRNAAGTAIDQVTYSDRDPWPALADEQGPSLELIDPTIENDDSLNWAASANNGGTPGAPNSRAGSGLGPRVSGAVATPSAPAADEPVIVTATVIGADSVQVQYRVDYGAEQSLPMASTGAAPDEYSATLPGVAAGHLLRYRVTAANDARTTSAPRADDSWKYQGVVADAGIDSGIPVLHWFIADADYQDITGSPLEDIRRPAAIAVNGQVIDNVTVNIRGQNSQDDLKPNWKFELPRNHTVSIPGTVEPVDEFAMQADYSDRSHARATLSWDSYRNAGVVNQQMFPIRTQRNSSFMGLYNYMDLWDGTWRDREGYDDDVVYKAESGAFDRNRPITRRFEKETPEDDDFSDLQAFMDGLALTGSAETEYMLDNTDLPQIINYAAVTAIVQHTDSSSKNWVLIKDSDTARWQIVPWDLDHTYGNTCCQVYSDFVTPAETGDKTSELMRVVLANPQWREMYFRRLATLRAQLLAEGRLESVFDQTFGPAAPEYALDASAWDRPSWSTYSYERTHVLAAVQSRRDAIDADARVPAPQSADPAVVISEIQHSPAAAGAQFVELVNPSTSEAVDLSGWTITGSIEATLQPGTVILPGQAMVVVGDDAVFRSAYDPVFVGDRFDGELPTEGTLVLTRPNGTQADTVAYGGAGWPQVAGGASLELAAIAMDNADPAAWRASVGAGTPGAGPVAQASVPDAPGIRAPLQGAVGDPLTVIVQWSHPANDGGSPLTSYRVRILRMSSADEDATVLSTRLTSTSAPTARRRQIWLQPGWYRFEVIAYNEIGASAPSPRSEAIQPR
ncbi:MAG: lamin tail domain-containing protein [Actinomycetales bacterium]